MRRVLLLFLPLLSWACAGGKQLDLSALASASDKIVWDAGQKAVEVKDWESARQYFRRIIDGFPQSEYQPAARLALGDTYFKEGGAGNYVLAVAAYREFLTLYPSHPRASEAQFQAAEAYFRQKNSPGRDQTPTLQALEEYQRLLDVYPESPQVEVARERIRECRQGLARHEFQVGYFYQRTRKAWRAAGGRYESILREYPDYERLDEVLFRLSECLTAMARGGEALPHLDRLLKEFPQSRFAGDAQKLAGDLTNLLAPAAPEGVPPVPPPRP
jgi:outer membrane protein assembly factor BamD